MSVLKIKDDTGKFIAVTSIRGEKGEPGPAYVLTEQDKAEIVAAVLAELNKQT